MMSMNPNPKPLFLKTKSPMRPEIPRLCRLYIPIYPRSPFKGITDVWARFGRLLVSRKGYTGGPLRSGSQGLCRMADMGFPKIRRAVLGCPIIRINHMGMWRAWWCVGCRFFGMRPSLSLSLHPVCVQP